VDANGIGDCSYCGPIVAVRRDDRKQGWRCPVAARQRYETRERNREEKRRQNRLKFIPANPSCEICDRPLTVDTVHVDHDHTICGHAAANRPYCDNCVRGILCGSCNTALGKLGDNPETIRKAAAYIEAARERLAGQ
jgi:hypothetical protein